SAARLAAGEATGEDASPDAEEAPGSPSTPMGFPQGAPPARDGEGAPGRSGGAAPVLSLDALGQPVPPGACPPPGAPDEPRDPPPPPPPRCFLRRRMSRWSASLTRGTKPRSSGTSASPKSSPPRSP